MIRICFHGAESTGKSTLGEQLAAEFGCPLVPEYGRTFAETRGTDFTEDNLRHIAREQDRLMRQACAGNPPLVILDTDPLMTAAWAQMLLGTVPDELLDYEKAEYYLLFAPDVPWVYDDTRFFGLHETRSHFAALAEELLKQAAVPYETIRGDWAAREAGARSAISRLIG